MHLLFGWLFRIGFPLLIDQLSGAGKEICCVDSAETSVNPGIIFSLNVPFQAEDGIRDGIA